VKATERTSRLGVIGLATLVVGGCSPSVESVRATPTLTPTAVSRPLSRTTWTDGAWPFAVPDGVLKCYAEDAMQTFTSGGVEYGLNATARHFGAFRNIDEIVPAADPPGHVEINGTAHPAASYAVSLDRIYAQADTLCS
jgi:hypothetical protein